MTTEPEDAPSSRGAALPADAHGTPTLFDIVLTGEQARELGVSLARPSAASRVSHPSAEDLDRRIQAAVDAALPKVTERTAAALRDALLKEVQNALQEPEP